MNIFERKFDGNSTGSLLECASKIYKFARAITLDKENESELGNANLMAGEIMRVADEMMARLSETVMENAEKSA